MYIQTKAIHEQ